MTGIEIIAAERQREIDDEGYTAEHDDEHFDCELALAAAGYAIKADHGERATPAPFYPVRWNWKPASPIRMLAKAGALIAAEIDRRLRAGETA